MAAFYLHELDERFEQGDLFYVRFMDDILILARTRCKIRDALPSVRSCLTGLRLDIHPDKSFIRRNAKGFDFLAYHFFNGALTVAEKTFAKMRDTVTRLYEQKERRIKPAPLGQSLTRWNAWFRGGLGDLDLQSPLFPATEARNPGKARKKQYATRG